MRIATPLQTYYEVNSKATLPLEGSSSKPSTGSTEESYFARIRNLVDYYLIPSPKALLIGGIVSWYVHPYVMTHLPALVTWRLSHSSTQLFKNVLREDMAARLGGVVGHFGAPFVVPHVNPWTATMCSTAAGGVVTFLANLCLKESPPQSTNEPPSQQGILVKRVTTVRRIVS